MRRNRNKQGLVLGKILFILYVGFLVYFLFFSEWYGRTSSSQVYRYNLVLFNEIKRFWQYREQLGWIAYSNIFGNVVIFIPFGFFMPMASKYKSFFLTTFYSFGLSLLVETCQLFTRVGCFDVDDILLNTIGGLVGYIIFAILRLTRRKQDANHSRKRSSKRKRKN